ncbi:MAG TPA: fibronectin type III domain-containing protein [Verrucomicrobiae bacterium]|nr:fibronectin type III domain-containing protein [Verrucomicrobiae bacterium]
MANYRVSLAFTNLPDSGLDEFASNIVASLTGNASFPTPLIPLTDITAAQSAFHNAIVAAAGGGAQFTAAKNEARVALENLLRQEAAYVQGVAGQNLSVLLSSGFEAASTNRTQSPLTTPVIVGLDNGQTTQLILKIQPVANARAYEVQTKNGGGWTPAGVFTQSRGIVLPGLTPGQVYSVQTRAVGGSVGYSDWSDPVSHMVI